MRRGRHRLPFRGGGGQRAAAHAARGRLRCGRRGVPLRGESRHDRLAQRRHALFRNEKGERVRACPLPRIPPRHRAHARAGALAQGGLLSRANLFIQAACVFSRLFSCIFRTGML